MTNRLEDYGNVTVYCQFIIMLCLLVGLVWFDMGHKSLSSGASSSSGRTMKDPLKNILNVVRENMVKKQKGNIQRSKLDRYSGTNFIFIMSIEEYGDLYLLAWGKER
ncbi:hypothetical protein QVD17_08020 [Tagetes erecta]|uniref:Uncharacterized protein n=1 Tax=Tagetes erecta TaxID=13708 RepID=A0AAD8L5D0_TARER|nr:hypothetical protein QVD17_08020 [Tagetes erecta]